MKIELKNIKDTPRNTMRRLGYAEHYDRATNQFSYVRRFEREFYPRFHVYVEERAGETVINLHLDMKKPSYVGSRAHSGEYEGPLLERERERILGIINKL
ncbi:MAG: hypothetical protein AAB731_04965 [Patescibacteria group bacterium]